MLRIEIGRNSLRDVNERPTSELDRGRLKSIKIYFKFFYFILGSTDLKSWGIHPSS